MKILLENLNVPIERKTQYVLTTGINYIIFDGAGSQSIKPILDSLFTGRSTYTCWRTGSSKHIHTYDVMAGILILLRDFGYSEDDYIVGNDAPRGGKTGDFINMKIK